MTKPNPILTGVSGEYFVAAELSRRGYIASITLRNTKGLDILCSNAEATKTVGIQVKAHAGSRRAWMLNEKAEDYYADNLFYVFVCLNNGERPPEYHIVPSKVVAGTVRKGHAKWLKTPGKKGQAPRETSVRQFKDPDGRYLDRWDLLGL